jgi:hypothetical protein
MSSGANYSAGSKSLHALSAILIDANALLKYPPGYLLSRDLDLLRRQIPFFEFLKRS